MSEPMNANYKIIKIKKTDDGMVSYSLERLKPGKVERFTMSCAEIKGASVGQEVAVDISVKIMFVIPAATVEDVGNTK